VETGCLTPGLSQDIQLQWGHVQSDVETTPT